MLKQLLNKINLGDCLSFLRQLPDNCIDLAFADPPFNLKKEYSRYDDSKELTEYLSWCEEWLFEMVRVTKPTGSICVHNIPMWLTYYSSFLNKHAYFRHWIAWDALSKPRGKTLNPSHYGILFYAKDKKKQKVFELRHPHKRDRRTGFLQKDYGGKKDTLHPFGPKITDVWTEIFRLTHVETRVNHPCQLPTHLLERIILMTTDKNDIVLDLFGGTGVSAVAAKKLDRKFVVFEMDKNYVDMANERLADTKWQTKLGTSYVSIYRNEVVSLRSKDWTKLKGYFVIPKPLSVIDHSKIILKEGVSFGAANLKKISSSPRKKKVQSKVISIVQNQGADSKVFAG